MNRLTRSSRRRARLAAVACFALLVLPGGAAGADEEIKNAESVKAASGVDWKSWHPSAFQRAQSEGRLILLVLDVPWSEAVAKADREVWTNADVVREIREHFVPIRERADLRPDLRRRYPAEGWPAVSILLPDGTPLVYDTQDEAARRRVTSGFLPAGRLTDLLQQSAGYWRSARGRAVENARAKLQSMQETARPTSTPLSDTICWSIGRRLQTTFDPESRYFGGPPRIPRYEVLELLLTLAADEKEPWETSASAALKTIQAKLVDEDGGVMRMAANLDWSGLQREKLLDRSAKHLSLLTSAYRRTGRKSFREQARKTGAFITGRLSNGAGFANAICESCPGGRDDTILTGANALAATSLIRAGAILEFPDLLDRGLKAARFLKKERFRPGKLSPTAVAGTTRFPPDNFVLDDQARLTEAFLAAFEATGDPEWLGAAVDLASSVLANFKDRQLSALTDIVPNPSAPAPLRFGVYPQDVNSEMARILVRLSTFTGDRRYRDAARGMLTAFGGSYQDSPLRVAVFGTAVYELLTPAVVVHIVAKAGDETAQEMRRAAMRSPIQYTLVRSWRPENDADVLRSLGLTIAPTAGAWVAHGGLISSRTDKSGGLPALINDTRKKFLRQREEKKRLDQEKLRDRE